MGDTSKVSSTGNGTTTPSPPRVSNSSSRLSVSLPMWSHPLTSRRRPPFSLQLRLTERKVRRLLPLMLLQLMERLPLAWDVVADELFGTRSHTDSCSEQLKLPVL